MKKTIILFIVIIIGYSIYYNNQYHVKNNNKSIKTYVEKFINIGEETEMELKIIEVVQLGDSDTYLASFISEKTIGYAILKKGLNNKMKIESARYGTNKIKYSAITTNKGNYGVLTGVNQTNIDHITSSLLNAKFTFTVNVSKERYFIKYKKLPKKIEKPFPAEFNFYDKNNNVLSKRNY